MVDEEQIDYPGDDLDNFGDDPEDDLDEEIEEEE